MILSEANNQTQESFIDRQKRLAGTQTAQAAGVNTSGTGGTASQPTPGVFNTSERATQPPAQQAAANMSGTPVASTPVSGSGKIPEPQPQIAAAIGGGNTFQPTNAKNTTTQQAAQPKNTGTQSTFERASGATVDPAVAGAAPAAKAQVESYNGGPKPPAGQADPFATIGGGVWTGSGWVPKGHPEATKAIAAFTAQSGASGGNAVNGFNYGSSLGQLAVPQTPQGHAQTNAQQISLIQQLLANPETMNANVVNAMKQKSQEESLLFAKQLQEQQAAQRAGSGMSVNGGAAAAGQRRMDEALTKDLITQGRDIDIMASQQNRADTLNALGAVEGILQGQQGRSSENFRNTQSAQQMALDDFWRSRGFNLQEELGRGGLALDNKRLAESTRQFNKGFGLNALQFLEGQRQHNNGMGLSWQQLQQNGQNSMLGVLQSMGLL